MRWRLVWPAFLALAVGLNVVVGVLEGLRGEFGFMCANLGAAAFLVTVETVGVAVRRRQRRERALRR